MVNVVNASEVFITEMKCVYCAVQTGSLNVIQQNALSKRLKFNSVLASPIRNAKIKYSVSWHIPKTEDYNFLTDSD